MYYKNRSCDLQNHIRLVFFFISRVLLINRLLLILNLSSWIVPFFLKEKNRLFPFSFQKFQYGKPLGSNSDQCNSSYCICLRCDHVSSLPSAATTMETATIVQTDQSKYTFLSLFFSVSLFTTCLFLLSIWVANWPLLQNSRFKWRHIAWKMASIQIWWITLSIVFNTSTIAIIFNVDYGKTYISHPEIDQKSPT